MTGSTNAVAPCPNIPPGWLCPWALRLAAPGRARYPGGGGGGRPRGLLGLISSHRSAPLRAYPAVFVARRAAYRSLFSAPAVSSALWPGLWVWSLPPCGTVPILSRLPGYRVALAAQEGGWGAGAGGSLPR